MHPRRPGCTLPATRPELGSRISIRTKGASGGGGGGLTGKTDAHLDPDKSSEFLCVGFVAHCKAHSQEFRELFLWGFNFTHTQKKLQTPSIIYK